MTGSNQVLRDSAAASAVLLYNCVIPAIQGLPPAAQYDRLALFIQDSIAAYLEAAEGWPASRVPAPSAN
jgi:hypothetical protein